MSKTSDPLSDDPFVCEDEDFRRRTVFSSPTSLRYKRDIDLTKTPIFARHPLSPPETCQAAIIHSLRRELKSARSSEKTALQRVAKLEEELRLRTDEGFRKVLKERDTLKRQEKLWEKECQLVLEELQMVKRRLYDAELRLLTMDTEEFSEPQSEEDPVAHEAEIKE